MKTYSPYQFSLFRILLGSYLFIYFVTLLPYATELLSNTGLSPEPSLRFTWSKFPNILEVIDTPLFVTIFVGVLALGSLAFLFGVARHSVALLLWYGIACLFNRDVLLSHSGLPALGWLLLATIAVPEGEPLSGGGKEEEQKWEFPPVLFIGAWVLLVACYYFSGFVRFKSAAWSDGSALAYIFSSGYARDTFFVAFLQSLSAESIQKLSYAVIGFQLLMFPLALTAITRKIGWFLGVLFLCFVMIILDLAHLATAFLLFHLFVFDSRWFPQKMVENRPVIFFDGVCGLCNGFVDFVLREDREGVFLLATLQGETAKERLEVNPEEVLDSIVFHDGEHSYRYSGAALRILSRLGGIWKLFIVFLLVPPFIRDFVYRVIAKYRYAWFGKLDTCRLPTPEERERFLP